MKNLLLLVVFFFQSILIYAETGRSIFSGDGSDSVKAVAFLAHLNFASVSSKGKTMAGIRTGTISLALKAEKNKKSVAFEFPRSANVLVKGMNVRTTGRDILHWDFNWNLTETYQLMVVAAADSARNFVLYSGYIFLPSESKWKLIGTCKITGQQSTITKPTTYITSPANSPAGVAFAEAWLQRPNGTWKNMLDNTSAPPMVDLNSHVDNASQFEKDKSIIQEAVKEGKIKVTGELNGVFYHIMREGSGNAVTVNDTVTVNYTLTLLNDTAIIDQTREKPATFPLNRLIKGWQIGVPLCKPGGKILLVIPSTIAYSIRTRSPKIPPNSILVFEIEVIETKPSIKEMGKPTS